MVVRISDKTQNYSKVTKLLVKPIKYDYENVPSYHPEDLKEYLNIFKENNINAFF